MVEAAAEQFLRALTGDRDEAKEKKRLRQEALNILSDQWVRETRLREREVLGLERGMWKARRLAPTTKSGLDEAIRAATWYRDGSWHGLAGLHDIDARGRGTDKAFNTFVNRVFELFDSHFQRSPPLPSRYAKDPSLEVGPVLTHFWEKLILIVLDLRAPGGHDQHKRPGPLIKRIALIRSDRKKNQRKVDTEK
ncbi:MAG: hypothetical protein AAGH41_11005 [Pseudomonadota bacterium]